MERTYDLFGAAATDLVEFYPTSVGNSGQLRSSDEISGEIRITGKPFTRIVFRPNQGTDILLDQFVESGSAYVLSLPLTESVMASPQALHELVLSNKPPLSEKRHGRGWITIASGITRYFVNNRHHADMSRDDIIKVLGDEAFGKVYLLKESDGWESPLGINEQIDQVCYLCSRNYMSVHDACDPTSLFIRLACEDGHGYHKRCILPWLWSERRAKISCPSCMDNDAI